MSRNKKALINRICLMSKFFNSLKQGLGEAIDYSESECSKAVVHRFDVKNIHSKVSMNQIDELNKVPEKNRF